MIENKKTDNFHWLWVAVGCFLFSSIFLAYFIDKQQNLWISELFKSQTHDFLEEVITLKDLENISNFIKNNENSELQISVYDGSNVSLDTLKATNAQRLDIEDLIKYPTNLSHLETITTKDDEIITVLINPSQHLLDKQNKTISILVIIVGFILSIFSFINLMILRRSKMEAELIAFEKTAGLLRSEAYFRTAMEASSVGMAIVGIDGRWLRVNNSLCQILKYSPEELLEIDFQTITHPDDINKDVEFVDKLLNGKMDTYQMEKRYFRKDGKIIWALLSVAIIRNEDGTPRHFISQIQDITVSKKTQQKLQHANAELEEFAYRTSHDLRSPLISSITLLDIARRALETDKIDKALKSIDLTQDSLVKLEALVQDILLLTQTKNMHEKSKLVDVSALLNESISKLSYMTNFDRLDIQKDLQFEGHINLKVSRFRLIIENLISNAIKYQDIEEDASFIKITTEEKKQFFVLTIEDNGLGIPKEHQDKLFSMFKRFHTKVSFGSGLGLYMVKKSADILDAKLIFEDSGKGCIFKLKIPLNRRKINNEN